MKSLFCALGALSMALAQFASSSFVFGQTTIDSTPEISWANKVAASSDSANGKSFSQLIQEDWEREDKIDGSFDAYANAAKRHLGLAKNLLEVLDGELDEAEAKNDVKALADLEKRFAALKAGDASTAEVLYAEIRGLKRRIVFANPLYQGYELLFCKRAPGGYSHLAAQYFGWRARSGGGVFVLEEPGKSLKTRCLTEDMPLGSFLEPRLSYDADKIVFSYVDMSNGKTYDATKVHYTDPDEGFYHVYSMDVDGKNKKQLTAGSYDDLMPNFLPDGDIVFSSTRRKGIARCFWWGFGRRWSMYTLHRMKDDGSDIKILSVHDTCEWFPTISPEGLIVYARWDYIDRGAVEHQNLWSTRPDGTNPQALWGNASPKPLCSFQARNIPDTTKYVCTASAHHSINGGTLIIIDPSKGVDGEQAITRITPDVPVPETDEGPLSEYYESPFPLSEDFYIVSYSPVPLMMEPQPNEPNAYGIYAYDVFGDRELIYRDETIGSTTAIPLRAEPKPPVVASALPENAEPFGEVSIENVYEGLGDKIKAGSAKELRIVQIFPKTTRDLPPVGLAGEENARAILGTVPIEEDGSAYFKVPSLTPILFQVLDDQGRALQTMRSLTYLQAGERIACVGCHEDKSASSYASSATADGGVEISRSIASQRAPSEIDPGELGGRPFGFMETIQPILDAKCLKCHNSKRADGDINLSGERMERDAGLLGKQFVEGTFNLETAPSDFFSKSYYALCGGGCIFYGNDYGIDDGKDPERAARALVPRYGGRNTIQKTEPGGRYGSIGARLMKILHDGHYKVKLTDDEYRKFNAWIDLNAIFYGVHEPEDQERQFRGERVEMPEVQ